MYYGIYGRGVSYTTKRTKRRRNRVLAAATALASLTAGGALFAPAVQANSTSVRYATCLNRVSDGFDGCWLDGQSPSTNAWWPQGFEAGWCNRYLVTYDPNTPASAHGVPRTNAIALQARATASGVYDFGVSQWVGVGGQIDRTYSFVDILGARIHLGVGNSFARVRIQASWVGGSSCGWLN